MATNDVQDPTAGDWWSQNAPPAAPRLTGPVKDSTDPRLHDPSYASDPEVVQYLSGIYGSGGTAYTPPANTPGWDPVTERWKTKPTETGGGDGGGGGGGGVGVPTTGFGAAPTPYASDPNAPTYDPLPPYVAPEWTGGDYVAPTVAELEASPGYQARMDAVLRARNRSAAAQGTVLNGGTLVALGRDAQNFASNEYQNLRQNTLEAYKQRYSQFTDAAGRDLASRTVNANDTQNTFANRTATYNTGNARTLSEYITNVTNKRNSELDYWNRLQDVNRTGADLAGGSR